MSFKQYYLLKEDPDEIVVTVRNKQKVYHWEDKTALTFAICNDGSVYGFTQEELYNGQRFEEFRKWAYQVPDFYHNTTHFCLVLAYLFEQAKRIPSTDDQKALMLTKAQEIRRLRGHPTQGPFRIYGRAWDVKGQVYVSFWPDYDYDSWETVLTDDNKRALLDYLQCTTAQFERRDDSWITVSKENLGNSAPLAKSKEEHILSLERKLMDLQAQAHFMSGVEKAKIKYQIVQVKKELQEYKEDQELNDAERRAAEIEDAQKYSKPAEINYGGYEYPAQRTYHKSLSESKGL